MKYNILALGTFPIDDTFSGSKYAINNIFKRLSYEFNIIYVSLVEPNKIRKTVKISNGFKNVHIPLSKEQMDELQKIQKKFKTDLVDFLQINHWEKNKEYLEYVKKALPYSDLIILEHPYLVNLIKSLEPKVPIIYHAIDAEFLQKKSIYKNNEYLMKHVRDVEKTACEISRQIWNSSLSEQKSLRMEYNIESNKFKKVPHGVDLSNTEFISRKKHQEFKSKIKKLDDKTIFFFSGSWHPPNLEALNFIISELAPINDDNLFFVIGNVKDQLFAKNPNAKVPDNVFLFGKVTDREKFSIYHLSDFAINPMFSGAGTNLKMTEFMAIGIPIISTKFGSRGLKLSEYTKLCDTKKDLITTINDMECVNYINSKSIK